MDEDHPKRILNLLNTTQRRKKMKARLSIVICVAALFLLPVSFAYAQQMDSSVFIPAASAATSNFW